MLNISMLTTISQCSTLSEYHYFLDMQELKDRIMVNEIRQYNWKKAVDKRRKMDEFIA